jgi:hypothetical protein
MAHRFRSGTYGRPGQIDKRTLVPNGSNADTGVVSVRSEHRLKRLRELVVQLEQLPPTAERDRMLREVRARVVDVDTGETPRAFSATDVDPRLAAKPAPPPKVVAPKPVERPQPLKRVPTPLREPVRPATPDFAADVLLSLDDSAVFWPDEAEAEHVTAPWTRGLRG